MKGIAGKLPKYLWLPLVLLMVVLVSVAVYQRDAMRRNRQETDEALKKSLQSRAVLLDNALDSRLAIIRAMSSNVEIGDTSRIKDEAARRASYAGTSMFDHLGIVLPSGNAYLENGSRVYSRDRSYFRDGMAGRTGITYVASSRVNAGESRFIFYAPIRGQGDITGVLTGAIGMDVFQAMLDDGMMNQGVQFFLCDVSGHVILSNANVPPESRPTNVLTADRLSVLESKADRDAFVASFVDGTPGLLTFRDPNGGIGSYAYQPLERTGWRVLGIASGTAIDGALRRKTESSLLLILVIVATALFLVFFILRQDRRFRLRIEQKQASLLDSESRLRYSEKRLQIALKNSNIATFEFDPARHALLQTEGAMAMNGFGQVIENVPDSLIDCGFVHPDSIASFRAQFDQILAGASESSAVVRVQNASRDDYIYELVHFTNLFDDEGKPYRAVGVARDVTQQQASATAYRLWMQRIERVTPESIRYFEYDLSQDRVEKSLGALFGERETPQSIDALSALVLRSLVFSEENRVRSFLNLENILKSWANGEMELLLECRYRHGAGEERWMSVTIHMTPYAYGGGVKAYIVFEDVNEQKQSILELSDMAQRDALTGLYNRKTAELLINQMQESAQPSDQNAFFMVDLDNFKQVNDRLGHQQGDKTLQEIAGIIKRIFRSSDIVARVGGDEFVVFLKNAASLRLVRAKAAELCDALQFTFVASGETIQVSASVGISCSEGPTKDFSALYQEADSALYAAKSAGRNRFELYAAGFADKPDEPAHEGTSTVQLRTLLTFMDAGVLLIEMGEKPRLLYVSPSFYRINKLKPEPLADYGQTLLGKVCVQDRAEIVRALWRAVGNDTVEDLVFRTEARLGDAGFFNMKSVSIRYADSASPVLIAVVTDITELKRSTIQLETIMKNVPLGIVMATLDGDALRVQYVNDRLIESTGLSREAFDQTYGRDITAALEMAEKPRLLRELAEIEREERPLECILRVVLPLREPLWVMLRAVCMTRSGGATFLAIVTDITVQKALEQRLVASENALKQTNDRLSMALSQSASFVWEVQPEQRVLRAFAIGTEEETVTLSPIPDCLTLNGLVSIDSRADALRFFENILNGVPQDAVTLILRIRPTDPFVWMRLSYRMAMDGAGKPLRAVGVAEPIPGVSVEKTRFEQEEQFFESMKDHLLTALKINLTRNKVVCYYLNGKPRQFDGTYTELLDACNKMLFNADDEAVYRARFQLSALKNAYVAGNNYVSAEYRRITETGEVVWMAMGCMLLTDPSSGELYGFLYGLHNELRRRIELSLPIQTETDHATRLYTPAMQKAFVNHVIAQNETGTMGYSMAILHISGLSALASRIGAAAPDRVLFVLGRLFRVLLSETASIARECDAYLSVFLPGVPDSSYAMEKMRQVVREIEQIRERAGTMGGVSFEVGVATLPAAKAGYDALRKCAWQACIEAGRHPRDAFVTYCEDGEPQGDSLQAESETALLDLIALFEAASSPTGGVLAALERLGAYYGATRVAVCSERGECQVEWLPELALGKGRRLIEPDCEWLNGELFQRLVNGVARIAAGDAAILVAELHDEARIAALLVVENPLRNANQRHLMQAAASLFLFSYRCQAAIGAARDVAQIDKLTGLYSREAFFERLGNESVEALSSLGVLFLDISGLSRINRLYGMSYGDRVVQREAEILREAFPEHLVYRYSGHEMVAYVPNYTYDTFLSYCEKVDGAHKAQGTRHAVGYTWTDHDIQPKKLLEHAESLMLLNKQSIRREGDMLEVRHSEASKSLLKALDDGRFCVYLQPKATLKDGRVVGAEALARLVDEQGNVLPPSQFISTLEHDNAIAPLDFFVLEEVLRILKEWDADDRTIAMISVNFSRYTLLAPDAARRAEALMARYGISAGRIELEVTETVGGIEHATLERACEAFHALGFQLSIDDFGSSYSSLSILSAAHFDTIKLDKSLVNHCASNKTVRDIAASIVALCEKIGIACIAEGVETREQKDALLALGCLYGQGYFYNKPLPVADFKQRYLTCDGDGLMP